MYEDNAVIVTRHLGAIEWLRRRGIMAPIVDHATPEDVAGKVIVGNVPFSLASVAREVWAIEMPKLWKFQRGRDLTADEMEEAGAHIRRYKVTALAGGYEDD